MLSCKRILLILILIANCNSYKILFIFPLPARSHNILATRLYTELANAGHDLTVLTTFPQDAPLKNIRQISLNHIVQAMQGKDPTLEELAQQSPLANSLMMMDRALEFTEETLKFDGLQKLLHLNENFDLVFIYQYMNDALLGIAHYFKAPTVLFSSMPLYAPESYILAHPTSSSYAPNIMTPYTGSMNFWERLWNTFYDCTMISYYNWFVLPRHRDLVEKYIPGQPDLYTFVNNISLIFINSHPSINDPLPLAPNAVEVGGFHIQKPKKLPNDLQIFLDNSTDGCILFSMGSLLRSAELSQETRNILVNTFGKLRQNILWKWEEDELPGLPKNIKQSKWIPQSDVLAHKNTKAFISHGGLLSTIESVHYGVPLVGIPIRLDQRMNMANAVAFGYAVQVALEDVDENSLGNAIKQVLNDPSFKKNILNRSNILRDRPMQPDESILYWVDYVVKYGGARHLRYSGMDLKWYQRNLIDVVAFGCFIMFSFCFAVYLAIKSIYNIFSNNVSKHKKNN